MALNVLMSKLAKLAMSKGLDVPAGHMPRIKAVLSFLQSIDPDGYEQSRADIHKAYGSIKRPKSRGAFYQELCRRYLLSTSMDGRPAKMPHVSQPIKQRRPKQNEATRAPRYDRIDPSADSFLQSYEWRRVRMVVLKRDGARCVCCGADRLDGVKMHVDHIKPRRMFPQLALDTDNLQVLCEACNHGKGNWDQTDWRDGDVSESETKLRVVQ